MLDDLISAYGNRFLVAALGVSLALLCLFIVLWILRNRAPSPFVRGGRNRQPRLQVLDAAAVDTRRRIVLIRRDNVEHLVMIGGPTDIVIESGIGDERPYLSARPVHPQAIAEQPDLPQPGTQAALPATEAASPMVPSTAAPVAAPVEPPARRQPVVETVRAAPLPQPARPQPSTPPLADQHRPQSASARSPEVVAERPATVNTVASLAATAAIPMAATTAATVVPVEIAAPVRAETPAIDPVMPPAPQPQAPSIQPTATLEPVVIADVDKATVLSTPEILRQSEATPPPAPREAITAGTPPFEALRAEPAERVMMAEPKPATTQDIRVARAEPAPVLPPVIDTPVAEDLLEAARQRVLVPAPTSTLSRPFEPLRFEPQTERQPAMPLAEPAARDMSDFERVLEEEMALHLAADPAAKAAPQSQQILPETRADRPRAPIAAILPEGNRTPGAAPNPPQPGQEPNLQTEIARIFGEMSASRNP
ncbi:hypothetical protein GVN24_04955 [Rhizobium sp. CRIBSB]|nr:hypothetical protein [Rhizobium sp. CRIBSB]